MHTEKSDGVSRRIFLQFLLSADIRTVSWRFILSKIIFNIGVLYLSAIVGKTLSTRFTSATGSAIVNEQAFGKKSMARKPIGYESR